jgi:hypothetical protein
LLNKAQRSSKEIDLLNSQIPLMEKEEATNANHSKRDSKEEIEIIRIDEAQSNMK